MVEILGNHIESFIWGCSDQEIVRSKAENKDWRFHFSGSESYGVDIVKSDVIAQIISWIKK